VGASMGGMIAQHVALDHRDRVGSLVLACTTPGGASRPPWRLLVGTALRGLIGPERSGKLVVPILYSRATRERHRDRLREDFAHRMRDATPQSTFHAQSRAIMGHDTRSRLGELAGLPTLVLHGEEDALVPLAAGERLADAVPGARLHVVPGAGHVLTTDAEEEVAAAILDHLRAASSASVPRRKAEAPAKR
jgi:3-oxoadipate enol-lactonase